MKPQLRFKEFTDEWEEKKFLDSFSLLMDYRGKTPKKLGLDWGNGNIKALSALNVKKGYIDWSADVHIGSEELYNAWMKKGSLKKDDILFTTEAPLGNVALVPDSKKYILSQRVIALRTNKNCNSRFIFQSMSNFFFQNQIQKRSTGTTAKGINQKGLSKIKIQLPSLPEQEKIGKFFSLLDQRIEKQERKVALLEEEKKGYMQRLFKQELRFKNEQGNDYPAWEEKKLGKIADIKAGKDLDKSKLINVGYPVYGNALTNKGLMGYYDTYEIKDEAVTVTGRGDIGKAFYRKGKFNTVGRLISIVSKENPYFLAYAINKIKILNETTGVPQLTALQLKKYKVQLPSLPEQEKIANFLGLLDQRIEKEQEKLELMKDEKKGFMQRMFV